ncbi:MAG: peptidoglycan recognition family protein [Cyanobacteria bacterium J06621_11]
MRQSWLIWATSTAAFFLTAATIVGSSSLQEPARGSQSFENPASFENTSNHHLGKLETDYRNARMQRVSASRLSVKSSSSAVLKDSIGYQPVEKVSLAHHSNYGERFPVDVSGNTVNNQYIVVLHETVGSASSALNTFQTNHPNDNDQVSYHTLIGLDGTVYYVVPPEQRAFGAGDSSFQSSFGEEAVFTNAEFPSSVNNFAYHISLETPPDGQNNNYASHSGYTEAQYQSLAWLLARTTVPNDRITTHKAVDRSGSRSDPRSFDPQRLTDLLNRYPSRAGL